MKKSTKTVLGMTNILSWIIFIGLCIQTGALLFSYFVSMFIHSEAAKNINLDLDLFQLYQNSTLYYSILVLILVLISGLKAYLFYFVIKIFLKLNFTHPFSNVVLLLITKMSYIAFAIAIAVIFGKHYCEWLTEKGIYFPSFELEPYIGGKYEFLYLALIISVIVNVFKRGIELQSENELTI